MKTLLTGFSIAIVTAFSLQTWAAVPATIAPAQTNAPTKASAVKPSLKGAPVLTMKRRSIAKDKSGCEIDYLDRNGERALTRRCGKTESVYFKLEDTSAPLLESKEFRIGKALYVGTRWATGQSEDFYLFNLAAKKAQVAGHTISSGPSAMKLDSTGNKVKVTVTERKGEGATATASSTYRFFP